MKTDRDLNYRLYIQRSDGFTRNPFQNELSYYRTIQAGDVEGVKSAVPKTALNPVTSMTAAKAAQKRSLASHPAWISRRFSIRPVLLLLLILRHRIRIELTTDRTAAVRISTRIRRFLKG